MGVPDQKLSSVLMPGLYLYPDNLPTYHLLAYEMGGIALNDPSEGMNVQVWTAWLQGDDVVVKAPSYGDLPPTVLFTFTGITEIDLAFDQNMNPFIAYVRDGNAWFWWYDEGIPDTVHTQLPALTLTPRCCLDTKLLRLTGFSDICLTYVRGNNLYYREQRERYEQEHLFQADVDATVVKIGMNNVNRLQWTMQGFTDTGCK